MQIKSEVDKRVAEAIAPWPIIASHAFQLLEKDRRAVNKLRDELLQEHRELNSTWFTQLGVRPGWREAPCIYIEDHRSISRISEHAAKRFEYRMLGLAGQQDRLLVSSPNDPDFEAYMGSAVGAGSLTVWPVEPRTLGRRRLALDALDHPGTFDAMVQLTKHAGGLNLVPYISSGDVWVLASALTKATSLPVCVTAPPPAISALANDKLWFARTVSRLIGARSVPLTREVYSMADLACSVRELASISAQLVFKLPASAGGLGNVSLEAAPLRGLSLKQVLTKVRGQLEQIGWRSGDKLLVGRWDAGVSASPSVQIWIPETQRGPPIIEGLFTQEVKGREGAFIGAECANFDASTVCALISQAMQIAALFQGLGYVGRLSLDAVLLSADSGHPSIHWIEANARWGGVSIPMTIARRISIRNSNYQIAITQHHIDSNSQIDMRRIAAWVEMRKREQGFSPSEMALFLVPPRTGLALIFAIAATTQRAHELADIAYSACSLAD